MRARARGITIGAMGERGGGGELINPQASGLMNRRVVVQSEKIIGHAGNLIESRPGARFPPPEDATDPSSKRSLGNAKGHDGL